jgi:hypothetical protein
MNIIKELIGGMDVYKCLNAVISNVFILVSFQRLGVYKGVFIYFLPSK